MLNRQAGRPGQVG